MRTLVLYRTMLKQTIITFRRYLFETLSGVITLFLLFLALFYGAKAFGAGAPRFGNALEGIVVGYMVWGLALFTYSAMAQELTMEAQLGTLEQLAMSPMGLPAVMIGRALSNLLWQLIVMSVMLMMMMASSGQWLHIDLISLLPLVFLTVGGVVGLSFAMGGLAIVFKRVTSALQILQIVFIGMVALPVGRFPWIKYFPLAWGKEMLNRVMIDGTSIFALQAGDVGFLLAHATAYIVVGMMIFKYFEKVARQRALLGHY